VLCTEVDIGDATTADENRAFGRSSLSLVHRATAAGKGLSTDEGTLRASPVRNRNKEATIEPAHTS
jgi:hypothetical protein